jgi:hypothetical protein
MADIFLNLDRQAGYLSDIGFLKRFAPEDFLKIIRQGVAKILPAIEKREVSAAISLGHLEERLDELYAGRFREITGGLRSHEGGAGDLVTSLMIVHYLERLGDLLLEIAEKIIYIIIGEKIKLEQYKALGEGLRATGLVPAAGRMGFKSIWGGRSGCRIGVTRALDPQAGGGADAVETVLFKHGPEYKITLEKDNLELWKTLRPGLTPEVRAYLPAGAGREATLILEYIPARNLQTLFLESAPDEAFDGLRLSLDAMEGVWRETMRPGPVCAEFTLQAEGRIREAGFLYPHLINAQGAIGSMEIAPLPELLAALKPLETLAPSARAMRVHGDFNLSNILYSPEAGKIHLLDLYRSRETDYVQDASVMLVSVQRLPVLRQESRARLNLAAGLAWRRFAAFAGEIGDKNYEARLAFGLARSFLSSARFVLEEKIAAQFTTRARYLLEKLLAFGLSGRPFEDFRLSEEVIIIGA